MKDSAAVDKLDDFLRSIVTPMLGYPTQLQIERTVMSQAVTFSLQASRSDTGRLIGERGGVFRGLRTLMIAYGNLIGLRVHLLPIQEPTTGADGAKAEPTLDAKRLVKTVEDIACKVFRYPESVEVTGAWHNKSAITIGLKVSPLESQKAVTEITEALQEIIASIAKSNGLRCAIDVATPAEAKG